MRIVHGSYPRVKTLNANRLLIFRKRMQPSAQFNATKGFIKKEEQARRMKWRPQQRQRRPEEATQKNKITGLRTCVTQLIRRIGSEKSSKKIV